MGSVSWVARPKFVSAETQTPEAARPDPWRHIVRGAAAGTLIGLADAADTAALGFLGHLRAEEKFVVFVTCALLMASSGVVLGALMTVGERGLGRYGINSAIDGSLRRGERVLLSADARLPLAAVWMWIALGASLGLVVRHMPLGLPRWQLMCGMIVAGAVMLPLGAWAARRSRVVKAVGWALVLAGSYFLASRVLYGYSRQGLTSRLHAVAVANILVMGWLAASDMRRSAARSPRRRWRTLTATAIALLVIVWLAPMLARRSHRIRLALLQRTALSFQLLHPGRDTTPAVLGGADHSPEPSPPPHPPRADMAPLQGVVMIVVDALRHDRVGRYERHGKSLTPSLDRFAQRAVRFERAYTTQPDTTGATMALMTSHFRRMVTRELMAERSVGAILRRHGIRTVALSSHPFLEVAMGRFEIFEQLGSAFKNRWGHSSAAVVEATLRQLDAIAGDRFFLVTHFYDPHAYYLPNPLVDFGRSELQRYDAEVVFTDHHIGKLIDGIAARGMNGSTAVIVVSDHGEEFGDHRYQRHLVRIYDESTRVVLLIGAPGVREGLAVQEAMSILDLPPTVLELLGVRPPADMVGRSRLATLFGGTPVPSRPVFVHSSDGRTAAVISENRKLMFTPGTGLVEYYDLVTDPGEQNNLADDSPPAMKRMGRQLRSFMIEHRLPAR